MTIFKATVNYVTEENSKLIQEQVIVLESKNSNDAFNEIASGLYDEGKIVKGMPLIRKVGKKDALELMRTDARFWVTI
ncbi:hypothetical protein NIAMH_44 [Serratia phage vB_SmaS_Niamh]|uniref:Uncharacterized protein n=1 Tax=Serratia phage vB_SmaS_Ulliraptor TaxID=2902694 RepID=A0AC61TP08_9CAUD|nr:hypothetical protein QJS27_gp42 [Serratia phage vB_SmaS_Ulliraptor]QPX74382.1 hypothetical protein SERRATIANATOR_26 [Serratia phage vB_SmaS_Serratianator]UGO52034.1 hypothetical protein ULLIRAPTOR_42 [Serratia phage vB_SmaS_Ulliraptor]UGO52998.1 hypothetical protein NIAMH_44 [Serratia phage vB_SmaS_Niamh]